MEKTLNEQIKYKSFTVMSTKSKNFQAHKVEITIELPEGVAVPDMLIREAQAKCRKLAMEQIAIDARGN